MTRTMYDGVTAADVPAGAQLYAGYLDGNYQSYPGLVAKFPNAVHVAIAVSAADNEGQVLDVENGDATAGQAVGWVVRRRAAGQDPTVYCNASTWPAVQAAFATAQVAQPHYWIADYSSSRTIPAGAIALQYADLGGYDASLVADYWPGIDTTAPLPVPAPAPVQEDTDMLIMNVADGYGDWLLSGDLYVGIDNPATLAAIQGAGVQSAGIDVAMHQRIEAAVAVLAPPTAAQIAAALSALPEGQTVTFTPSGTITLTATPAPTAAGAQKPAA